MLRLLEKREKAGELRGLRKPFEGLMDFASNDYLGLSRDPRLQESFLRKWEQGGRKLGSTGSRLLTGGSLEALQLEEKIASYHDVEAALLFSSGFMANLALAEGLLATEADVFYDVRIHASLQMGLQGEGVPFRHRDPGHLEKRLKKGSYILIEAVDSCDGTLADLHAYLDLAERYGAHLIVDEAHSVGVLGERGKGISTEGVFARVVTYGKALGVQGGAILGSQRLKAFLINAARPAVYTTAPFFPLLSAIDAAYDLLPTLEKERKHLHKLTELFGGGTHIQRILDPTGNTHQHLRERGFATSYLRSPTVPRRQESIRVSLHAYNTEEEVKCLVASL